jgi:hypothetical protein
MTEGSHLERVVVNLQHSLPQVVVVAKIGKRRRSGGEALAMLCVDV